ncbi:MAG: GerAB/ArcD/ProY family transporter, partial [Clostridiales bacterium]|nr:GerAB/ArcD/ProY family transporter [Clostridiales bacterium]
MAYTKGKISTGQFFSILFISRLVVSLMYVSAIQYSVSTSDIIAQGPIMLGMLLIIVIPTCIFIKTDNSRGLFNRAYDLSPVYMRVLAVIFILSFLFACVRGISRFDLFATSIIFPERDISLLLLVVLAACAYVATLGLEAIGRSAALFTVIVSAALIFVFVTITEDLHINNLTPLFYNGALNSIEGGITSASVTVELGAITILLPNIKGKVNKALFRWLFILCGVLTAIAALMVLSLGFYGETQLFPIFTIAVLGEFGVFQRLDAI